MKRKKRTVDDDDDDEDDDDDDVSMHVLCLADIMINYPNSLWTRLFSHSPISLISFNLALRFFFVFLFCLNVERCLYRVDFIVIIIIIVGVGIVAAISTAAIFIFIKEQPVLVPCHPTFFTDHIYFSSFFLISGGVNAKMSIHENNYAFFLSNALAHSSIHLAHDHNRQMADHFFSPACPSPCLVEFAECGVHCAVAGGPFSEQKIMNISIWTDVGHDSCASGNHP